MGTTNIGLRAQQEWFWGTFANLGPLLFGVFAPLSVWLVWRRRNPFLERSSREALNMQISYLVYLFAAAELGFMGVGPVLVVFVVAAWFVLVIMGARGVGRLEVYHYPGIFRLLS